MPPIVDEEPEELNFEDLYSDDAQQNEKKVPPHVDVETKEDGPPNPEMAEPASKTLWFLQYPPTLLPPPSVAKPANPPAREKQQAPAPVKRSERIASRQSTHVELEGPKKLDLASGITTTSIDSNKDSREGPVQGISIRGRAKKGKQRASGRGAGRGRRR